MAIKWNGNDKVLLSPSQVGRIKMLLYLADGQGSLQLSDTRIYRAWKEFFFESLCEMEELGLLKSIRTYPLGSMSMLCCNSRTGIGINEEEWAERSCCPNATRSPQTNRAGGTGGISGRARAEAKARVDRPFHCKDNCNEIREYQERRYMRRNMDKNKKKNKNKSKAWDAWDVSGKAIEICPVLNWLAKQECDRINPHWLNKAWKSFLLDILCQLEAEGLIKVSDGQASRPGD